MQANTPREEVIETYLQSWDSVRKKIKLRKKKPKSIGYKEVSFQTDEAILVVWSGDWHLGSEFTQEDKWTKMIDDIYESPNTYLITGGDLIDNFAKHSPGGAIYDQNMTPSQALNMAAMAINHLKDKILGMVQGCHDAWSYTRDATDITYNLSEDILGYNLGHAGYINLSVGSSEYRIYARHKYRNSSRYNLLHGVKTQFREKGEFDIGLAAHLHTPGYEMAIIRGKKMYSVRCGSFKITDRWQDHNNFGSAVPLMPAMYLNNKQKQIIVFENYEDGIKYLRSSEKKNEV